MSVPVNAAAACTAWHKLAMRSYITKNHRISESWRDQKGLHAKFKTIHDNFAV
jgi:ribosomal protein L32E